MFGISLGYLETETLHDQVFSALDILSKSSKMFV